MILNRTDALYAANVFVDYFSNFGRIDDYLRRVKLERMSNYPVSLPGMGPEDDMFNDFDMHPNDMEFECKEVSNEIFVNYLEIVTSHAVEVSVPGKSIKWVVYEKNTGQIAGFIRLGSPTINSKPRNDFLGKPLNTLDPATMKRFNDSTIMGFIIVQHNRLVSTTLVVNYLHLSVVHISRRMHWIRSMVARSVCLRLRVSMAPQNPFLSMMV